MFEWLSKLFDWIAQFFPRWEIVDTTHGAVKFVRGRKVVKLGPGWHCYWPLTTKFDTYPTARQAEDLRSQTMVTADDKTIIVGGMIVYEVTDVEPLLAHTFAPDQTVRDIALTCFHDVICQLDWSVIREKQRTGALDRMIRAEAKKALEPYGVKVLKTMLTDLAQARVYKLLQTTNKE